MMGLIKRIRNAAGVLFSGGDYNATDPRRYTNRDRVIPRTSSSNSVLTGNIEGLRNWARFLERNHPTARAAVEGLVAVIVGTGIDVEMEPLEDALESEQEAIEAINRVWHRRIRDMGVNGESLYDLQRLAVREEVTAGEGIQRIVTVDGERRVLPLESEWLIDYGAQPSRQPDGSLYVAGLLVDKYNRASIYHMQDPDTLGTRAAEKVPARSILHNFQEKRANQVRGESWFTPVIETMRQEEDLIVAELEAAKNTAGLSVFIKSDYHDEPESYGDEPGNEAMRIQVGTVIRGAPGEEAQTISHTRPSQQIAPFSLFLRQRIAASLRVPVRFLDRDVGKANFSSMRTDVVDTERLLAPDRERFVRQHTYKLYRALLPEMAAEAGVSPPKRYGFRAIPDGTPYVNPREDIQAASSAIAAGISTLEAEVGKRGGNWKQVQAQGAMEKVSTATNTIAALSEIQKAVDAANKANPELRLTWQQVLSMSGIGTQPASWLQAASTASDNRGTVPTGEPDSEDV